MIKTVGRPVFFSVSFWWPERESVPRKWPVFTAKGFAAPYQDHYCNSHNVNVNTFLQKLGLTLFEEKKSCRQMRRDKKYPAQQVCRKKIFLLTRNYQPTAPSPPPPTPPQKLYGRPLGRGRRDIYVRSVNFEAALFAY